MEYPLITEVLPEERIGKVVKALAALGVDFQAIALTELAALLSPYMQIENMESTHQERVLCLADIYAFREKLMDRERKEIQKKSELFLQILDRAESSHLGLHIVGKRAATGQSSEH